MGASGFWVGRDEVNGGALREKATEDRCTHTLHRTAPDGPGARPPRPSSVRLLARTICQCEAALGEK